MATISGKTLSYTSDSGSTWYSNPSSGAWYFGSETASNRVRYIFTVTPGSDCKISKISFTVPVRKSGTDDGYVAREGTLTAKLYKGSSSGGTAIASASKSVTFDYYSTQNFAFTFTIPDSVEITEATTFCVAVFATVSSLAYSGAVVSAAELHRYTVTYDANGVGDAPDAVTVYEGSSIELPELTASGYEFFGWGTTPTSNSVMTGSYTPTGSITLYAIWATDTVIITFDDGEYKLSLASIDGAVIGADELPEPYEIGKTLLGWYNADGVRAEAGNLWNTLFVDGEQDINLYSRWEYERVEVDGQLLAAVADAIRSKCGQTSAETYTLSEMPTAITDITTLNFNVLGGTSEPGKPSENDIWVNTDVEITDWTFSAEEPESPVEGMVWVRTGRSSNVAFNALSKNSVQVYPISVKQYNSGTWASVIAKTYQGGVWNDWGLDLYVDGSEWKVRALAPDSDWYNAVAPTATKNSDGSTTVSIYRGDGGGGIWELKENVDLTNFKTLNVLCTSSTPSNSYYTSCAFLVVMPRSASHWWGGNEVARRTLTKTTTPTINTLDISALSGSYDIAIGVCWNGNWLGHGTVSARVYDVYFE